MGWDGMGWMGWDELDGLRLVELGGDGVVGLGWAELEWDGTGLESQFWSGWAGLGWMSWDGVDGNCSSGERQEVLALPRVGWSGRFGAMGAH